MEKPVDQQELRRAVGCCVKLTTNRGKEYTVQISGIKAHSTGLEYLILRNPETGGEVAIKLFLHQITGLEAIKV